MATKTPYWQKLQDPRWQKKRLEILERDGWKCRECDDAAATLHVHHRYYVSDREPWQYPKFCYVTLCADCHKVKRAPLEPDEEFGFEEWEFVAGAFLDPPDPISPAWDAFSPSWDIFTQIGMLESDGVPHREIMISILRHVSELRQARRASA